MNWPAEASSCECEADVKRIKSFDGATSKTRIHLPTPSQTRPPSSSTASRNRFRL